MVFYVLWTSCRSIAHAHRNSWSMEKMAKIFDSKPLLKNGENSGKLLLRCVKGTRDYGPKSMAIRQGVLNIVTECFKRHGAETIDTPVFELRDVLLGKYGEEGGKLIFDLADQGGEQLSLRYDLTVPFARYLAMNKITNIKRYHVAKVYRRDQPVMSRGRYREFFQCDFDIAGQYDLMVPEAECLRIVDEVFSALDLGVYETKLNHRLLLEGIFSVSGVETSQFKTVCSSVDKLDKISWNEIQNELTNEKGIRAEVVGKLENFVRMREQNATLSSLELLEKFEKDEMVGDNSLIQQAIAELRVLLKYCDLFGVGERVVFEPALARGLDYYTGAIYETVLKDFAGNLSGDLAADGTDPAETTNVGSVAAGGRYDKLVGTLSAKQDVPCVGVSFGIERIFSIMEMKAEIENKEVRTSETEVYVASAQKHLLEERMKLCKILWDGGIKAEMAYKANVKLLNQLQHCEKLLIPVAIIIGERELQEGVVKLRNIKTRVEKDIPLSNIISEVRLCLETLENS